uniref:Uncharacterized protein n=1 Tax=Salvator merianae TaxID=96440 RepID=A0A8D0BZH6_SALMN
MEVSFHSVSSLQNGDKEDTFLVESPPSELHSGLPAFAVGMLAACAMTVARKLPDAAMMTGNAVRLCGHSHTTPCCSLRMQCAGIRPAAPGAVIGSSVVCSRTRASAWCRSTALVSTTKLTSAKCKKAERRE